MGRRFEAGSGGGESSRVRGGAREAKGHREARGPRLAAHRGRTAPVRASLELLAPGGRRSRPAGPIWAGRWGRKEREVAAQREKESWAGARKRGGKRKMGRLMERAHSVGRGRGKVAAQEKREGEMGLRKEKERGKEMGRRIGPSGLKKEGKEERRDFGPRRGKRGGGFLRI